jgi:hypothetical protein
VPSFNYVQYLIEESSSKKTLIFYLFQCFLKRKRKRKQIYNLYYSWHNNCIIHNKYNTDENEKKQKEQNLQHYLGRFCLPINSNGCQSIEYETDYFNAEGFTSRRQLRIERKLQTLDYKNLYN